MFDQINDDLWYKFNGLSRYFLAHFATNLFPLYIVNEYPKSGGSWVSGMLSDLFEIPFPRNRLPMMRSSILHGHMMQSWGMKNVLIVWRDGRDVMISLYYHSLFNNDRGNSRLVDRVRSDLKFSNYNDIKSNLPVFIEYTFKNKSNPKMSWSDFVMKWVDHSDCVQTKYEDMRINPIYELKRIASALTKKSYSQSRIEAVVGKHSFENLAGRKPGIENHASFLRKGIVGDWKNHFSKEAKMQFDFFAGDALIKLGYEPDHSWVNNDYIGEEV